MPIPFRGNPFASHGLPQGTGWTFYRYMYAGISAHYAAVEKATVGVSSFEVKTVTQGSGGNMDVIFASNASTTPKLGIVFNFNPRGFNVSAGGASSAQYLAVSTRVADPLILTMTPNKFKVKNTLQSGTAYNKEFDITYSDPKGTQYSMYIGGNSAYQWLYYVKQWDDGVLVHWYIPCKNPEGVYGYWDRVGQKFYKDTNGKGGGGTYDPRIE